VYRGQSMASMRGRYFFADFITRRVWSLALTVDESSGETMASDLVDHTDDLSAETALGRISSFGVDATGELYIVSYSERSIFRIGQPLPLPVACGSSETLRASSATVPQSPRNRDANRSGRSACRYWR
jgi:hypothetical protein